MQRVATVIALVVVSTFAWARAYGQESSHQLPAEDLGFRVQELERGIDQVKSQHERSESEIQRLASNLKTLKLTVQLDQSGDRWDGATGGVLFLIGVFCALWAQNTNRNPWLWFFMGLVFNVITLLVLLSKNADDSRRKSRGSGKFS